MIAYYLFAVGFATTAWLYHRVDSSQARSGRKIVRRPLATAGRTQIQFAVESCINSGKRCNVYSEVNIPEGFVEACPCGVPAAARDAGAAADKDGSVKVDWLG